MIKVLLIAYDNGSHIHFPPHGLMYLTSVLQKQKIHVDIWQQDIEHYPAEKLTEYLDMNNYDIVGLGFIAGYYQYKVAKQLAAAVNASKNRGAFSFILGGHGPAAAPKFFMNKLESDSVFVGESILSIIDYINCAEEGVYECDHLVNPDYLPLPAFKSFPMKIYRLIRWPTSKTTDFCFPVLSGMGCKWSCSFCYRMDKGFRPRTAESVIDEISYLWRNYRINHFQFSDELFMSSEKRVLHFCEKMLESPLIQEIKDFKYDCNGRLNFAKPDVLRIMKKSGCEYVNYGIESLNKEVLNNIKKGLTAEMIVQGVEFTLAAGLSPGINFMWGNIGDTPETLEEAADFIIKYNPGHELRTIRPVTPYPGSPLFDEAIKRGLVDDVEDFYENKHVNSDLISCNFMDLSTDEAHNLLYKANLRIMQAHYEKVRGEVNRESFNCYMGCNNGFRGFRSV